MKEKINIAEILKDKPQGTKLYSRICGAVELKKVIDVRKKKSIVVKELNSGNQHRFWHDGNFFRAGQCVLQPSENMADWSKFSWKKGDVLQNNDHSTQVIFDRFISNTYEIIRCKYWLKINNGNERFVIETNVFTKDYFKVNEETRQSYINEIENRCGGKLNLETLEIEKAQTEFKDGDIVFMKGIKSGYYANCIFILRSEYKDGDERAFYYAFYNTDDKFTIAEYGYTRIHYSLRLATDSEKQQLFDALAKKGKTWDSDKKQIVDLPKKCEFKVFEKVLVRESKTDEWTPNFFFKIHRDDERYVMVCGDMYNYCIPYNEDTAHLLGTTDDWEGGEQ